MKRRTPSKVVFSTEQMFQSSFGEFAFNSLGTESRFEIIAILFAGESGV